jgi:hypothetical protein
MMLGMFTLVEIKLQVKMQIECNYNFYPILFIIVSKFVNYIMKSWCTSHFQKVKLAHKTNQ